MTLIRVSKIRDLTRMLRAYVVKDTTVICLIQQDPTFKKMTPDDILGKIINHEMLVEEANHVKNLTKGITSLRKQDIALKASKKTKKKQIVIESSSEEDDDDDDDDDEGMTLFIKNYNKFMAKRRTLKRNKEKSQGLEAKECAIIVARTSTSLLNAHMRERKKMKITIRRKTRHTLRTRKTKGTTRRSPMVKLILDKSGTQMMRAPTQIVQI
jgi:hypothetical protein